MMGDEDKEWIRELIKSSIHEAITEERRLIDTAIDKHVRSEDHVAMKFFLQREKRNQEIWDKAKGSVLGIIVVGSLYWIGFAVWEFVMSLVRGRES